MQTIKQDFEDRPLPVTFLVVFVLCITPWYAIRIYSAIVNWQTLREFGANPAYILGTGLLWALASVWVAWQLWEGRPAAGRAGWMAAVFYLLWYWFDRLAIQPSPATNAAFSAIVSAILFGAFTLGLLLPSSKAFFQNYPRRQNDREDLDDSDPA
jgi:hypothetical protein